MCRKHLHGNVVHSEKSKVAFENLKSRMTSVPYLVIPKMGHEAKFVVATDNSKDGIARLLLQEETFGSLRPCYYWAKIT